MILSSLDIGIESTLALTPVECIVFENALLKPTPRGIRQTMFQSASPLKSALSGPYNTTCDSGHFVQRNFTPAELGLLEDRMAEAPAENKRQ